MRIKYKLNKNSFKFLLACNIIFNNLLKTVYILLHICIFNKKMVQIEPIFLTNIHNNNSNNNTNNVVVKNSKTIYKNNYINNSTDRNIILFNDNKKILSPLPNTSSNLSVTEKINVSLATTTIMPEILSTAVNKNNFRKNGLSYVIYIYFLQQIKKKNVGGIEEIIMLKLCQKFARISFKKKLNRIFV